MMRLKDFGAAHASYGKGFSIIPPSYLDGLDHNQQVLARSFFEAATRSIFAKDKLDQSNLTANFQKTGMTETQIEGLLYALKAIQIIQQEAPEIFEEPKGTAPPVAKPTRLTLVSDKTPDNGREP